ncbi:MAG TPA: hypothetical protein VHC63_13400 [Acidimicrobiales bacterium]|nr:hypothetical protein [Acidimicrobiales bacterium]
MRRITSTRAGRDAVHDRLFETFVELDVEADKVHQRVQKFVHEHYADVVDVGALSQVDEDAELGAVGPAGEQSRGSSRRAASSSACFEETR